MPIRPVRITSPSRLHFGMLSFGNLEVPQFGGAGVMIDEPGVKLDILPSPSFSVRGTHAQRVEEFVRQWAAYHDMPELPACTIEIWSAPPQHVGLGTGTQLALSVAAGLVLHLDRPFPASDELARSVQRGRRSAVGTYGFLQGGLIVEMGKRDPELTLGEFATRVEVPSEWCFVLALPKSAEEGMSGSTENAAFARLPAISTETSLMLRRELRQVMLPAAARADFTQFSQSLYRFGRQAGECFSAVQGGPYASEFIQRMVDHIRRLGVDGVGQSSWGPTVFAVTPERTQSQQLIEKLEPVYGESVYFLLAKPHNLGFAHSWL